MVGGLSSLSAPTSQVLLLTGSFCSYTSGEVADVAVSPMDVAKLLEGLLQPKLRVKWLLSASLESRFFDSRVSADTRLLCGLSC